MKANKVVLQKGYVLVYNFGNILIHNYNTLDPIDDQVILLEKNHQLIVIESPSFYDNEKILEEYIKSLQVEVKGVILSYHMAGGSFLKNAAKYTTKNAFIYATKEDGKALIEKFTTSFGKDFDAQEHAITHYIENEEFTLADIQMKITLTDEAFDIEFPEIQVIYTHMLGSDCHSIIAGPQQGMQMLQILDTYLDKNYQLILTSHYIPETLDAVRVKKEYIKNVLALANQAHNASEMQNLIQAVYPNYQGLNYLEMTTHFFFPSSK